MRLRLFEARSTTEAMRAMRETLGDDAIIVATQDTPDGVRVTAAVESPEDDLGALLAPAEGRQCDEAIREQLQRHGLDEARIEVILDAAARSSLDEPVMVLATGLDQAIGFRPLGDRWSRPVMLIGPPGAGKAAARHEQVTAVTCDADRAGGAAQFAALLKPMGLRASLAADPKTLRAACAEQGDSQLVIDSTGINPFRGNDLARLAEFLHVARAEPVLVMPAGLMVEDAVDLAASFRVLGVRRQVVTKLDLARRLGGLLGAAMGGIRLAEASLSPLIGQKLHPLTPSGLARLLLRPFEQRAAVREGER